LANFQKIAFKNPLRISVSGITHHNVYYDALYKEKIMDLKLACIADEQRARGQEGFSEGRKLRGQEVKPFNNSSIDEIPQQPLTETNHSTVQPFNHSTDNGYTSKKAFTWLKF
jgi:hypothetical protein